MKTLIRLLPLIVLLLFPSLNFAQSPVATPQGESINVQTLMEEGNMFAEQLFKNDSALQRYLAALALQPHNAEILWRISRTYIDIGEHLPVATDAEKKEQLAIYERALGYAQRAVAADGRNSMAYTRRAIANGRIALFKGVWESLDLVKQSKADLEKAIQLDPTNATAYYVLGRTHAKVSERPRIVRWPLGLGWANLEEAVKQYETAIALRPDFIMYRLDCARAYIELDDYEKARTHLSTIASLPTKDEDDDVFRKEARELLERIRAKE